MIFSRFLLTGGLAALVNIGMRYALNFVMSFEWAVGIAYLCGMITAYILARAFVFNTSNRSNVSALSRFAAVNLVSLGIVWLISVILARKVFPALAMTWHANDIAHVAGVCCTAVTSYLAHKHWSFR